LNKLGRSGSLTGGGGKKSLYGSYDPTSCESWKEEVTRQQQSLIVRSQKFIREQGLRKEHRRETGREGTVIKGTINKTPGGEICCGKKMRLGEKGSEDFEL